MVVAKPKSGALVSLFSIPLLYRIKTVIRLFSTGCRRVSSRRLRSVWRVGRGEGKNWRGLEPGGMFSQLPRRSLKTHANQWYLRTACDLRRCSWCFEQNFEDGECYLLQIKCMMSASVEFIFYWARLIISVWDNEPKLKKKTVNYFALRHHWSIEEYTREHSESVKRYARIAWASLISSLKVARYDCLPHRFSLTFQLPLFG